MARKDMTLTVVTQPDRPAGRGRKMSPTPVAECAAEKVPVKKFGSVNDPRAIDEIGALKMDILIVCDFGQILKPVLLALPSVGPYNLHGSILPAYRGAAPIQRALLDGVSKTGVTLLRVNERCDAGAVVSSAETDVGPNETFGALHARLSKLGPPLLESFLNDCAAGRRPKEIPQDEIQATSAPKIKKEELHLDFARPAPEVHNRLRAFSPSPGAFALWKNTRIKFLKSSLIMSHEPLATSHDPSGTVGVTPDSRCLLTVLCGDSTWLQIEELQPEGGRVLTAREMMSGHPDLIGALLA